MCQLAMVAKADKYTHLMVKLTNLLRCVPAHYCNQGWQIYTPYGRAEQVAKMCASLL